eukprot:scaffold1978_cov142-Skeletonema_marinoi.AAC.2
MSDRMQILHTFDTSDRICKRRLLAFPRTEEKVCSKKRSILKQLAMRNESPQTKQLPSKSKKPLADYEEASSRLQQRHCNLQPPL